jgi:cell wall-associated NlpC family hydrolase
MASRTDIVSAARGWLGTPFRHQGRVKGLGLDCVGLPIMVAHELGITAKDGHAVAPMEYCDYPEQPVDGRVLRICQELMIETSKPAQPGDVLCFRVPSVPCHVAIVSDLSIAYLGIIHVNRFIGRVVEHRLDQKWRRRIAAGFNFAGVL